MRQRRLYFGMMALAAGCAGRTATTPTGTNQAGVVVYQVTETSTELTIVGVDGKGQQIGSIDVKSGRFVMNDGFAEGRGEVDGRRLDIDVNGEKLHHESEGYTQLKLPLLRSASNPARYLTLNAFITDQRIAATLQR